MRATSRGFTLLETMIVVTIIGIVSAMAVATLSGLGARNAPQNATNDVVSALQLARSLSLQNGSDVYVVVYPHMALKWLSGSTFSADPNAAEGRGVLFIYEDIDGDFLANPQPPNTSCSGAPGESCHRSSWNPVAGQVYTQVAVGRDRLVKILEMERYPKKNVKFGATTTTRWKAPYSGVTDSMAGLVATTGCSFCTNRQGAILFSDGRAVTLDENWQVVGGPIAGLGLQGVTNPDNEVLLAVVRSTGIVTAVK